MPDPADLGPQHRGDSAFTARMRRHQSWYRAHILGVPWGTGPGPRSRTEYGNMLSAADGQRGLNFLAPEIFAEARRRLTVATGVVEEHRLLCNLLSSQPMCFNLFGLMASDRATATRLWRATLGDGVAEVTRVSFELAPEPRAEYLDDHTAFDAHVEYRQPDGTLAFVGIETKLTEPFSLKVYDSPAYRRWMGPASPWRASAGDAVAVKQHNQLWRDHLLCAAMLRHPRSPYANGRLMLVRHPGDSKCAAVVARYSALLRADDASFIDMPLDRLIATWSGVELDDRWRAWRDAFHLRYLDLSRSAAASPG
jgi:hypothetical protein